MKTKLIIILFLGLNLNLKAQSVTDGALLKYGTPLNNVLFIPHNTPIQDSVAKYEELFYFYLHTDKVETWRSFHEKYTYWKVKQDSLNAIEDKKRFFIEKQRLEQKYKIKLPWI